MQILRKTKLEAYKKAAGLSQKELIKLVTKKKIIGRGGAGFSAGSKWEMVFNADSDENFEKESNSQNSQREPAKFSDEKFVICNADEGEPGTFKDRFVLMNNPELVIEGILIACYAVGAKQAYIYLRNEYDYLENNLKSVIKNVIKNTRSSAKIDIIVGAGAYICGDETAIMESIEGKRGQPRSKPPYPVTKGLFGKPTLINNVETLANVPLAVLFDDYNPELRLYSLSGNVTKPGVYELPLGTSLCKLIEMGKPKNKVKAVYFGCFGGCIPYCEIRLTPENICGKDCMLGACTIIVVDENHSIVDLATVIAKFYDFESCGKCTPCREGTMRVLELLEKISLGKGTKKDLETLQDLAEVIKETSFCGLGETSTHHLITALKYFRKEFEAKVR